MTRRRWAKHDASEWTGSMSVAGLVVFYRVKPVASTDPEWAGEIGTSVA